MLSRLCRDTALSWYKACIMIALGESRAPKGKQKHSDLFKEAWKLFRECQYMQPDMDLIRSYIDKKFGFEVTSQIGLYRPTPTQKVWAPKKISRGCGAVGRRKRETREEMQRLRLKPNG